MSAPRCAVYCRLSKEDAEKRTESESIQNQKSLLIRYAQENDWQIYDLYCDEDYSGADAARPDFNRMLRDAQAGCFDIVLCKTQSRFTRDMELVEKYIHGAFPLWGIRFVAIADNIDTQLRGNKKARQINGLVNEWYLEDLSENIRMVLQDKRQKGQYIGSVPIYGYQRDPNDRHRLVIDEKAASVVRQIFTWRLEGCGKQHIAQLLNAGGIDNPATYKQKRGIAAGTLGTVGEHGLWSKTTVGRILQNEMYIGVMVQGRRRKVSYKSKRCVDVPQAQWCTVAGTHEPIVDAETFLRAQSGFCGSNDGKGTAHTLAGLVYCADCGSVMHKTSNSAGRTYLRCKLAAASTQRALCTRHSIRLDRLVTLVGDCLRTQLEQAGVSRQIDTQKLLRDTVERIEIGEKDRTADSQAVTVFWKF